MTTEHTPPADSSNTTPIQRREGGVTGKGFVKGDKRINRGGRPKTFDKLRSMVVAVLNETIPIPNGETTRLNLMIKTMVTSGNPADHKTLLEYGFGKVKDELELNVKDLDHAINAELEKLARRGQGKNARAVASADGDSDSSADPLDAAIP